MMQSNLRALWRRCPGTSTWSPATRNAVSACSYIRQQHQQHPHHRSNPGSELASSPQCCRPLTRGLAAGLKPGSKSWRESSSSTSGRKVHAGVAAGFPLSSDGDDDTSPLQRDPLHNAAAASGGGLPDSASLYRKDLRK